MDSIFTVEQANRMLPLVSRIVADIVHEHRRWQDLVREFELLAATMRGDQVDPRSDELQHTIQASAREIDRFLAELRALGVEFKSFDMGLVDFPGMIDGRRVCLCWHLGERAVQYWHEPDAGFAGRRPLDTAAA